MFLISGVDAIHQGKGRMVRGWRCTQRSSEKRQPEKATTQININQKTYGSFAHSTVPTRFVHKEKYAKHLSRISHPSPISEFSEYAFTYSLPCSLDAQRNFVVAYVHGVYISYLHFQKKK